MNATILPSALISTFTEPRTESRMKISVVTSVFNRADMINDALQSVAQQTHSDVEHIVQDGASSDGTLAVLQRDGGPSIKLRSEPDTGLYDGINRGIMRATGDVVGLMHSDDLFADEHVLSRVAETMNQTGADGVYGDLVYVAADNPNRVIRYWKSGGYNQTRLRKGWMPPHPTLYLRRDVFDHFGLYDTSFQIAADYEAMLRYLIKGKIRLAYLPEVMVRMRVGGESNRSLGRILHKSREDYRAMRLHGVGGLGTLIAKNTSKIGQFFRKG